MSKTLSYDEKVKGWTSFHSYEPEMMVNLNNEFFSFKDGQLYLHNQDSSRNTFYGQSYNTEIEFVANDGPSEVKIFKTIEIEGDSKDWDVTVATDLESGHVNKADFENKEGFKYSYIRRNAVDEVKTDLLSVQGIGNLLNIGDSPITTTTQSPTTTTTTDSAAKPSTTTTTTTSAPGTVIIDGLTYNEVVNPVTGRIWLDRNLGATRVATSATDTEAFGWYYQWGRGTDGHQISSSETTSVLSSTPVPGHGDFITSNSSWMDYNDYSLWQGVDGGNNPGVNGFRLPTEAEWEAERASWSSQNIAGAYASPLKFTLSGHRNLFTGGLDGYSEGRYWSSTNAFGSPTMQSIKSTSANILNYSPAFGFSVRLIKD